MNNENNNMDINSMFSNMNAANPTPTNNTEVQNGGMPNQNINVAPEVQIASQTSQSLEQPINNMNINPTPVTPNLTPVFPTEVVANTQNLEQVNNQSLPTNNTPNLTFTLPGEEVNNNGVSTQTNLVPDAQPGTQMAVQPEMPQVNQPEQVVTPVQQSQPVETTNVVTQNNMDTTNNVNGVVNTSNATPVANVAPEQVVQPQNTPVQNNVNTNVDTNQPQPVSTPEAKPEKVKKPFNKLYLIYGLIIIVLFTILVMMLTKTGPFADEVPAGTGGEPNIENQPNTSPDLPTDFDEGTGEVGDSELDNEEDITLNEDVTTDENVDLDNPDANIENNEDIENDENLEDTNRGPDQTYDN